MTERHKIAQRDELQDDGSRVIVELEGQEIAVFNIEGELFAVANYCVHQAGPLCEGPLAGRTTADENGLWEYDDVEKNIVCPWHGWMFDVTTGENIDTDRYSVPTYGVEVDGEGVFIEL